MEEGLGGQRRKLDCKGVCLPSHTPHWEMGDLARAFWEAIVAPEGGGGTSHWERHVRQLHSITQLGNGRLPKGPYCWHQWQGSLYSLFNCRKGAVRQRKRKSNRAADLPSPPPLLQLPCAPHYGHRNINIPERSRRNFSIFEFICSFHNSTPFFSFKIVTITIMLKNNNTGILGSFWWEWERARYKYFLNK